MLGPRPRVPMMLRRCAAVYMTAQNTHRETLTPQDALVGEGGKETRVKAGLTFGLPGVPIGPWFIAAGLTAAAIHAECSHGVHGPASLEELLLRQHCPLALLLLLRLVLLLLRLVLLLLRLLLLLLLLLKQQGPCIHLHHKKKPVTVRPLLQLKCSQLLWLRIKPRCAGKHSSTLSLQGSHQDAGTSADVAGLHCKLTCSCGVWPNALRFWSSLS